jgi:Carbohydrate family 9 binding domain-like
MHLLLLLVLGSPPLADGGYVVERTTAATERLLAGNDEDWRPAGRLSFGSSPYRTAFRALWSASGLYLWFDVSDPAPWHTMRKRDQHLWEEEVVEIFLDLDGSGTHYAEIELSPANVVCDVRMIRGAPGPEGDLAFNLAGLQSRVAPKPSIGWTGVIYVPWSGFRPLPSAATVSLPPKPGDRWRFNVYRIERPHGKKAPEKDAIFSAWSPTGEDSFHVPRAFQFLEFGSS